MMMGHREKLKGGDEYDLLRRGSRRVNPHRAGQVSALKRQFNKRQRRNARRTPMEWVLGSAIGIPIGLLLCMLAN